MKTSRSRTLGLLSVLALSALASQASAAGSLTNPEKVVSIQFDSSSNVFVTFAVALSGYACTAANNKTVRFDGSTDQGRTRLALFQGALMSGRKVKVTGTGACSGGGTSGYEFLNWMHAFDDL